MKDDRKVCDCLDEIVHHDVVLFYGPPFVGKTLYYLENLAESHLYLCPADFFKINPDTSIRQMINKHLFAPISAGKKIVIDDTNETVSKRESYLDLLRKRLPNIKFSCINFEPSGGHEQLLWTREMCQAHTVVNQNDQECTDQLKKEKRQVNNLLQKWDSLCECPTVLENMHSSVQKTVIKVVSKYQFEVPVLFIQWEGLVGMKDCMIKLVKDATEAINNWTKVNPGGRTIVIYDGCSTQGVPLGQRQTYIKQIFRELTNEVKDAPVFLMHIEDPGFVDKYSLPPNPGLLAYLQRLYHLSFSSMGSMYLYHTATHMKLAERAGIKHIKASRLFSYPKLAKSSHAATSPDIPAMIKTLEILPPFPSEIYPVISALTVPLCDQLEASVDLTCDVPAGNRRRLHAAASSVECVKKCRIFYEEYATLTSEKRSKLLDHQLSRQHSLSSCESLSFNADVSTFVTKTCTNEKNVSNKGRRDLPKWMFSKRKKIHLSDTDEEYNTEQKKSENKSLRKSALQHGSSDTVYVMDQTELLQTAEMILHEAGLPFHRDITLHKETVTQDNTTTDVTTVTVIDPHTTKESVVEEEKYQANSPNSSERYHEEEIGYETFSSDGEKVTFKHKVRTKAAVNITTGDVLENNELRKEIQLEQSVADTCLPSFKEQKNSAQNKEQILVPDSFVPDTVTVVPETVTQNLVSKTSRQTKFSLAAPDFSLLDDIV